MLNSTQVFKCLSEEAFGSIPASAASLPQAGGDRRYWRFCNSEGISPNTYLGVEADSSADAKAFLSLSDLFRKRGVNVPEIYAATPDLLFYLEEDLGNSQLFSLVGTDKFEPLAAKALKQLVRMQTVSQNDWEDLVAYPPFCERQVMFDLNYFKYEYLKNAPASFDEEALQDDFECFARRLVEIPDNRLGFMMRDFQSRNVMVVSRNRNAEDGKCYLIDYQGGRKGPCLYDAVSFLWQARAALPADMKARLLRGYAEEFAAARRIDADDFLGNLEPLLLFRTLQVLGAYGFRGLVQKRAHFVESIPGALDNLADLINKGVAEDYPELERVCKQLVADSRFPGRKVSDCSANAGSEKENVSKSEKSENCSNASDKEADDRRLHIKVFSFSYKKGYPEDLSGNGGGFMFDCRGMHNPGRYEEYKQLTGRDLPVIEFLKKRGEADKFAAAAVELVSPTIAKYIERGFSSLQIGFGCTGGQHRSVYCAEAAYKALSERFPEAKVELIHREHP